jgi:ABC-2 type transport system permease protein
MTAPQTRAARAAVPSLTVRARDVLAFEWTKLRSVRSTYWSLLIAAAFTIGYSVIAALVYATTPRPRGAAAAPINPLSVSFAGLLYAVLAVGVLGVLSFSSEYATGLIRTTFTAVPRRLAVLAAKAAVAGTAALIAGELLSFASFFLAQAILSGHHRGISLSHPGVPGAVLAAGFLLFVCAMVGLGLGAIIRHTAGAVAALFGLIYIPVILYISLPSPWNARIGRLTLTIAGTQVVALRPQKGLFSPALSMLVVIAWTAATLLAAALLITRRDA